MQAPDKLKLAPVPTEDVLAALGEECAMGAETGDLFRRLVAREDGIDSFQWHPQKLAGRVQTTILRPDLSLEVWEKSAKREDFETTVALAPVRARLDALAQLWGFKDAPMIEIAEPGARSRMSPLAERMSA
jgi:hypothetical protein